MALIHVNEMIAKACDTPDAKVRGQIIDKLRAAGCNYLDIWERVQKVRPNLTQAEWDALLYEADTAEGE